MNDSNLVRIYLESTAGSLAQWKDGMQTLCWSTGETIAFAAELRQTLEPLSRGSLPPFAALMLVLSATRDKWPAFVDARAELLENCSHIHDGRETVEFVYGQLNKIHQIDKTIRNTVQGKSELLYYLFHETHQVHSTVTDSFLSALFHGLPPILNRSPKRKLQKSLARILMRSFHLLRATLSDFRPEQFEQYFRTGLDQPLPPAELDETDAQRTRKLLDELINDPELSGLARAAQQLMSVVSVPRPLLSTSHSEEGGISDLSNRGSLDRLLVSELANDDLTLAVRIALNEALYYRKESPPAPPNLKRNIILG